MTRAAAEQGPSLVNGARPAGAATGSPGVNLESRAIRDSVVVPVCKPAGETVQGYKNQSKFGENSPADSPPA